MVSASKGYELAAAKAHRKRFRPSEAVLVRPGTPLNPYLTERTQLRVSWSKGEEINQAWLANMSWLPAHNNGTTAFSHLVGIGQQRFRDGETRASPLNELPYAGSGPVP